MTQPVTRAHTTTRTLAEIDGDLRRHAWLLQLAIGRLVMDVAQINRNRIDQLLDERLAARE